MRALSFGLALRPRPRRGGSPPPAAPAAIAAVNADGWSAEWAGGTPPTFAPDAAPQTIAIARQGFDSAAQPATYPEARLFTRRRRLAYPDQNADAATTIVLDDYVYSTDTVAGAANLSAETSPRPVAAWAMPHRAVVGNVLPVELVAFHRDGRSGRMVAAVRFTATDGVATVSQLVSATTLSRRAGDRQPLPVYAAELDIAALATGLVTVNAEIYPWIGDGASVLRSAEASGARDFSPRYFLKNPALAAAPPLAYVAQGGSDAAGVVSTEAATARAAPFLTVRGAIDGLHAALGATTGVDGAIVRVGAGSFALTSPAADRTQRIGALTISRDPLVPRSAAIVTWGSTPYAPRLANGIAAPLTTGCLRFHDLTVQRTGVSFLQGQTNAALEIQWDDVTLDNGNYGPWLTRSSNTLCGVTVVNAAGAWLGISAHGENRLVRGVEADLSDQAWESWVTLACSLTRPGGGGLRDATRGAILFQNRFLNPSPANAIVSAAAVNASDTIAGLWVVQNLVEVLRTGAGPAIRVSSDHPARGHTDHCGPGHNTVTGYGAAGRHNLFYDSNTNGERRTHRRAWHKGDILAQLNNKGDVFIQDAAGTGGFAYHHGVGCQGNWSQFRPNAGAPFFELQAYPGPGSSIGTSVTARNDPRFLDYRGVGAEAGAGGGDYRLAADSPARGIVRTRVLSHDLAGAPRPAGGPDHAGAYA